MEKETYFVFEKWSPKRFTRIHKDECPSCFFGRGTQRLKKRVSCKWNGPYETLEQAAAKANAIPESKTLYCKICLPEMPNKP